MNEKEKDSQSQKNNADYFRVPQKHHDINGAIFPSNSTISETEGTQAVVYDLGQLSTLAKDTETATNNNRADIQVLGKQLSTDRSNETRAKERMFPSLPVTMFWLIALTLVTFALALMSHAGINNYWIALPFQAYWSYWLITLSHACGKYYKCSPPVGLATLIPVLIANFVLLPAATYYHFIRLLDPFFYLWLLTLAYVPYKIGKFLDKQETKDHKGSLATTLLYWPIALCGGAAAAQLILPSDSMNPAWLLDFFWFVSQVSWISYVVLKLSGKLELSTQITESKQNKVYAGTNIVIRYRAFPELERWFKQKFGAMGVARGTRLLFMWFGGPALVILSVLLLSSWVTSLGFNTASQIATTAIGTTGNNIWFITNLISVLVMGILVGIIYIFTKPTHLALGEQGMRFLWRSRLLNINGKYMPWSQMTNIYIEHNSKQLATISDRLCLRDNQNHITKIRLSAIDSYEDKELLLNAIRTWAPQVSRDAQVIESLQPPSDYSYTELWLQALSAPPKRERFKPLAQDALLKNNRYRVLNSLGTGGQGVAYLAEDCSDGKQVVLKEFILPVYVDVSVRKSALKQFENEARILSQLQHPQIVRLLDFFVEDHRAYLVLEHIDGSSMRTIIEHNGPLSEKNTLILANQMCNILSYLHSQTPPVVHRDFTPDNLILNTDGILKLIDFNVAQNTDSTTTGSVVGKPAYLPPEQFRGMPTTQSDIYALGATLYFLLTAKDPKPISVSHPSQLNPELSPVLDNIIATATNLDTVWRYQSIADLKKQLPTAS